MKRLLPTKASILWAVSHFEADSICGASPETLVGLRLENRDLWPHDYDRFGCRYAHQANRRRDQDLCALHRLRQPNMGRRFHTSPQTPPARHRLRARAPAYPEFEAGKLLATAPGFPFSSASAATGSPRYIRTEARIDGENSARGTVPSLYEGLSRPPRACRSGVLVSRSDS